MIFKLSPSRREALAGFIAFPTLFLTFACLTAYFWPEGSPLGDLGRVIDSLVFHLTGIVALGAALLALLGWRRFGGIIACAAVLQAGLPIARFYQSSMPLAPQAEAGLTILWFNMLHENSTRPQILAEAIAQSSADLVILAETTLFDDLPPALLEAFPEQLPCKTHRCETIMLSRRPLLETERPHTGTIRPDRMAVMRLALTDQTRLTVIGAHWVKPWMHSYAAVDDWLLQDVLKRSDGPAILIGDLNAAPWSGRMRKMAQETDLRPLRWPIATWPSSAGNFGVPLDQVWARRDVIVQDIQAWGADLGSNHRGLLIRLAAQPASGA